MGFTINQLLDGVKTRSLARKKTHEEEIQDRRDAAVTTIADAARVHLDDGNKAQMKQLAIRLSMVLGGEESKPIRISLAEAYAQLAEEGDFFSGLYWWELRDNGAPVDWKGYSFYENRQRRAQGLLSMEVRRVLFGGYVCEMTGAVGRVCSYVGDGIDFGPGHADPMSAIESAYSKYCILQAVPEGPVPHGLTSGIESSFGQADESKSVDSEEDARFNV